MIRSALAVFAVILSSVALIHIPGQPDSLPLPAAMASPPELYAELPAPVPDPVANMVYDCDCDCDALEARVAALESVVAEVAKKKTAEVPQATKTAAAATCPSGQCPVSNRAAAVVYSPPSESYTPRWQNYDGLSFRQHAEQMHGINTAGLSDAEVGRMRDHDHDTYGGGHPAAMRQRTVQYSTGSSNCPGGVCPTRTTTVQSRGGVFGFGILGRRR